MPVADRYDDPSSRFWQADYGVEGEAITSPGPTIKMRQGETVTITFENVHYLEDGKPFASHGAPPESAPTRPNQRWCGPASRFAYGDRRGHSTASAAHLYRRCKCRCGRFNEVGAGLLQRAEIQSASLLEPHNSSAISVAARPAAPGVKGR